MGRVSKWVGGECLASDNFATFRVDADEVNCEWLSSILVLLTALCRARTVGT